MHYHLDAPWFRGWWGTTKLFLTKQAKVLVPTVSEPTGVCLPLRWGFEDVADSIVPRTQKGCPLSSGLCVISCPLCKWSMKIIGCFLFLPLKPWKQWPRGSISSWDKKERLALSLFDEEDSVFLSPPPNAISLLRALLTQGHSEWSCHFKGGLTFGLCCLEVWGIALCLPPPCITYYLRPPAVSLTWRLTGQSCK